MAYGQKNISPLDLKPSTGIGVAIPFNQPSVFKTVYTTQEEIKYNLINFILTNPGERVYQPTFGLGLRNRLFLQLTDSYDTDLKDAIINGIETYFPNVQIVDLQSTLSPDTNTIQVSLSYRIINTNQEDQIILNIPNGQ